MMIDRTYLFLFILISSISAWGNDISLDLVKWHKIKYGKIEANTVRQVKHGLEISVNNSSSPLVYKFDKPISVKTVHIDAKLIGKINYQEKMPGSKHADDFPLRLGLILKGENKLNFF